MVCSALKKKWKCGKNEEKPCLNGFQPIFPGHVGTQKPDIGYLSYHYSLARFFMVHVLLQILFTKNLIIHVQYLKHFEYLLCTCNTLKIGLNTCTENLLAWLVLKNSAKLKCHTLIKTYPAFVNYIMKYDPKIQYSCNMVNYNKC